MRIPAVQGTPFLSMKPCYSLVACATTIRFRETMRCYANAVDRQSPTVWSANGPSVSNAASSTLSADAERALITPRWLLSADDHADDRSAALGPVGPMSANLAKM